MRSNTCLSQPCELQDVLPVDRLLDGLRCRNNLCFTRAARQRRLRPTMGVETGAVHLNDASADRPSGLLVRRLIAVRVAINGVPIFDLVRTE